MTTLRGKKDMSMREAGELMDLIGHLFRISPALLPGPTREKVVCLARAVFVLVCEGRGYSRRQAGYALFKDPSVSFHISQHAAPAARYMAEGILRGHLTRRDALAGLQTPGIGIPEQADGGMFREATA